MKPSAIRFFYKNAGYSYDPATETRNQGRWRCARQMANAEALLDSTDAIFTTEEDFDDCVLGECETREDYVNGTYTMYTCQIQVGDRVLTSLSGVSVRGTWDDNYMRVIKAELALGVVDDLEDLIAEKEEQQVTE